MYNYISATNWFLLHKVVMIENVNNDYIYKAKSLFAMLTLLVIVTGVLSKAFYFV